MTFRELRGLYDEGQTEKVLEEIGKINPIAGQHAEHDDLITLAAWCYYRQKKFREAHAYAVSVGNHHWAHELLAAIYAYVPEFKNDEALLQIAAELGDVVGIANAMVIRARAKDCTLFTHDQVMETTRRHANNTDVSAANLHHNAGRYFLEKARGSDDLTQAVSFLETALRMYGPQAHFHHRAAAHFWASQALEKRDGPAAAIPAMKHSVHLWQHQLSLDPNNRNFQKSAVSAQERLTALRLLAATS